MYLSLNQFFKEKYGTKGYKIALRGGMTCPNRDGTCGTDGCVFCTGAGEFAERGLTVTQQIEQAIKRIEHKNKNGVYIAYFQDYSNTYAPIVYLEKIFREAIKHPKVAVLSIATRPDCLPNEVVELIKELNAYKPVWIELGLQTIHESTAEYIGRGYGLFVYDDAVRRLHEANITVITHLILGLPGETKTMVLQSIHHISKIGTDGVKFHLLHVSRGTKLYDQFLSGKISTLSFPEYLDLLAACINFLPPHIVVHRLTGDGDKRTLVSPLWSADKKHVLNAIKKYFLNENVNQGRNLLDNDKNIGYNIKK